MRKLITKSFQLGQDFRLGAVRNMSISQAILESQLPDEVVIYYDDKEDHLVPALIEKHGAIHVVGTGNRSDAQRNATLVRNAVELCKKDGNLGRASLDMLDKDLPYLQDVMSNLPMTDQIVPMKFDSSKVVHSPWFYWSKENGDLLLHSTVGAIPGIPLSTIKGTLRGLLDASGYEDWEVVLSNDMFDAIILPMVGVVTGGQMKWYVMISKESTVDNQYAVIEISADSPVDTSTWALTFVFEKMVVDVRHTCNSFYFYGPRDLDDDVTGSVAYLINDSYGNTIPRVRGNIPLHITDMIKHVIQVRPSAPSAYMQICWMDAMPLPPVGALHQYKLYWGLNMVDPNFGPDDNNLYDPTPYPQGYLVGDKECIASYDPLIVLGISCVFGRTSRIRMAYEDWGYSVQGHSEPSKYLQSFDEDDNRRVFNSNMYPPMPQFWWTDDSSGDPEGSFEMRVTPIDFVFVSNGAIKRGFGFFEAFAKIDHATFGSAEAFWNENVALYDVGKEGLRSSLDYMEYGFYDSRPVLWSGLNADVTLAFYQGQYFPWAMGKCLSGIDAFEIIDREGNVINGLKWAPLELVNAMLHMLAEGQADRQVKLHIKEGETAWFEFEEPVYELDIPFFKIRSSVAVQVSGGPKTYELPPRIYGVLPIDFNYLESVELDFHGCSLNDVEWDEDEGWGGEF